MAVTASGRSGLVKALDQRFGLSHLAYAVPRHSNTLPYSLGGMSLISFLVLLISGIVLTQFYHPMPEFSNDSVRTMMQGFGLARLVRGIHYWAAQVFLITVLLHMIRIFTTASFKRPREGNWLVGVFSLGTAVALYFTGTVLKWDQEGFEALEHNLAIGHLLGGLWHWFSPAFQQAMPLVLRLYIAHIVVLPGLLIILLVVHVALVKLHGISSKRSVTHENNLGFTDHLAHLGRYALILTGLILILAVLRPPVVGPAPVEGIEVTKPPWPFLPLFAVENWVGVPGLLWVSVATFAGLALVPLLDRSPHVLSERRRTALVLGAVFLLFLIGLAVLAWLTPGAEHLG